MRSYCSGNKNWNVVQRRKEVGQGQGFLWYGAVQYNNKPYESVKSDLDRNAGILSYKK